MPTGLYNVFGVYVQCLQMLFQQNKLNISFRETVRLINRNPLKSQKHEKLPSMHAKS